MKSPDTLILEQSLRVMSAALDALVGQCLTEDGKPKAPERGALMKARAMLPPSCQHALAKKPSTP